MNARFKIRHGGQPVQQIALTMRAEMFEAIMAVSYAALVTVLVVFFWQG
jgi:hypothetical protein